MPKYIIEAEDGSKFEIDADNEQAALAGFNAVKTAPETSPAGSALRGARDGLLFGFDDEIGAGIEAPFRDATYDQVLKEYRDLKDASSQQNPASFIGGQITGALAPMLIPGAGEANAARVGVQGAGSLARAGQAARTVYSPVTALRAPTSTIGRMGAGAADNALYGALHGFGSGEGGAQNRATQAGSEGALGAISGAAIPAATGLADSAFSFLTNPILSEVAPELKASQYLGRLTQADLGPEAVSVLRQRAQQATADNVPATLGPLSGENATKATYEAAATSGPNAQATKEALRNRIEGRPERMMGYIDQNIAPGSNAVAERASVEAANKAASDAAYAQAMQVPVPFDMQLAGMLSRPTFQEAMGPAQQFHARRMEAGLTDQPLFTTIEGPNGPTQWPTMEGFQSIKQALQGMADNAYSNPLSAKDGPAIKEMLNQYRARLGAINPAYAAADAAYGEGRNVQNAFDLGGTVRTINPQALSPALEGMTPEALQAVRVGAAGDLVNRAANGGLFPRNLMTPAMRDRLAQLAPDPESAARLQRQARLESQMMLEEQKAVGGSRTNEHFRSGQDSQDMAGILSAGVSGSPVSMISSAFGTLGRAGRGMRGPTLERAAQMLNTPVTSPDFSSVLDSINSAMNGRLGLNTYDAALSLIDALAGRGATVAVGNKVNTGFENRQGQQ